MLLSKLKEMQQQIAKIVSPWEGAKIGKGFYASSIK